MAHHSAIHFSVGARNRTKTESVRVVSSGVLIEDSTKSVPNTKQEILAAITKELNKTNFSNPYTVDLRLSSKGPTRHAQQNLAERIGVTVEAFQPWLREIAILIHIYRRDRICERVNEIRSQNQELSRTKIIREIAYEFGVTTVTIYSEFDFHNKNRMQVLESRVTTDATSSPLAASIQPQIRRKTRAESDAERRHAGEEFIRELSPAVLLVSVCRAGHYIIRHFSAHVLKSATHAGLKVADLIRARQLELLQEADSKGQDMQTVARNLNIPSTTLARVCKTLGFEFTSADRKPDTPTNSTTNAELNLDTICVTVAKIQNPFRLKVDPSGKTLVGISLDLIALEAHINPVKLRIFIVCGNNAKSVLSAVDEAKKLALLEAHQAGVRFHTALIKFGVDRHTLLDAIERLHLLPKKLNAHVTKTSFTAETMGKLNPGIENLDPDIREKLTKAVRRAGPARLPTTQTGVPQTVFSIVRENLGRTLLGDFDHILMRTIWDYGEEISELIQEEARKAK